LKINSFGDDKKEKIPPTFPEEYKKDIQICDNIIIFIEFLKDFVSIISHKFLFENTLDEMFDLYSTMLDNTVSEHNIIGNSITLNSK